MPSIRRVITHSRRQRREREDRLRAEVARLSGEIYSLRKTVGRIEEQTLRQQMYAASSARDFLMGEIDAEEIALEVLRLHFKTYPGDTADSLSLPRDLMRRVMSAKL